MSLWKTALYDTCSLITLDKLLLDRPSLSRHFPKKLFALEVSLSADQMYAETAERISAVVDLHPLPTAGEISSLFSRANLSRSLSDVDKLIFATVVHFQIGVVTGDKRLAKAVKRQKLPVGNMALILQELVVTNKLKSKAVEKMLQGLVDRKDYLLGIPNPTWKDLKAYTFPD